jgi:hypothetical protein
MAVVGPPQRNEVCLATLDPTQGGEIQKTRPCLVVSPDEMNQHLQTVIVAPMTTVARPPIRLFRLRSERKRKSKAGTGSGDGSSGVGGPLVRVHGDARIAERTHRRYLTCPERCRRAKACRRRQRRQAGQQRR